MSNMNQKEYLPIECCDTWSVVVDFVVDVEIAVVFAVLEVEASSINSDVSTKFACFRIVLDDIVSDRLGPKDKKVSSYAFNKEQLISHWRIISFIEIMH